MKRVFLVGLLLLVFAGAGGWFLFSHNTTRHCLLQFGPNGLNRIWVNVSGQRIDLARENSDGQLIEIGRYLKFDDCRDVEVSDSKCPVKYVIKRVSGTIDPKQPQQILYVTVEVNGPLVYRQSCDVELARQRGDAKVAHFDGPLAVGPSTLMSKLPRDFTFKLDAETDLSAMVGTTDADRGCWVAVLTHEFDGKAQVPTFPAGVHPVVDVQFPPRQEGDPPVYARYPLDQFCCGCLAHGPVRVPADAGVGIAKVTFSFGAWEGANVQPTTIEVPVVNSQ